MKHNKNKTIMKKLFVITHPNTNNNNPIFSANENDKSRICIECNKKFYDKSTLNIHIKNVHQNKKQICIFCSGEFKYINKHLKNCQYKRNQIKPSINHDIDIKFIILNNSKIILNNDIYYYPNLLLGKGVCMSVYYGRSIKRDIDLAIKIHSCKEKNSHDLLFENYITQIMENYQGFPRNYDCFKYQDKTIIAQTLFGPNIRKLFDFCGQKFTLRTICLIFLQSLKRLKNLHQLGFLHNDINMQNFTWGCFCSGKLINRETINLIDFSLSSRYIYPIFDKKKNKKNIIGYEPYPKEKIKTLSGTLAYLDKSVLDGYRQCRKTDLISLIYLIIEMFKGDLPWSEISTKKISEKIKDIKNIHKNLKIIDLFSEIPPEFYMIYNELQKLKFEDEPEYDKYERIILDLLIRNGGNIGEKFCWEPKIEQIIEKNKIAKATFEEVQNIYLLFGGSPR